MTDAPPPTGFSLRRWSQRKLAAGRGDEPRQEDRPSAAPAAKPDGNRAIEPVVPTARANREQAAALAHPMGSAASSSASASAAAPAVGDPGHAVALPPLESLTIDSDFSPFMQAGVDEDLKRSALRKLLRDPQFNVMDGLDVYIDDYSKPSPLEPELARTLMQARYIFDPPKTRVTAEGIVEDVPEGEDAVVAGDADAVDAPPPSVPVGIEASANATLPAESAPAGGEAAPRAPSTATSDR